MSLPVIADVGIGLIIIYLSAALIISGIQEIIATILQWRSKHLKESILQMMIGETADGREIDKAKQIQNSIYKNPLMQV